MTKCCVRTLNTGIIGGQVMQLCPSSAPPGGCHLSKSVQNDLFLLCQKMYSNLPRHLVAATSREKRDRPEHDAQVARFNSTLNRYRRTVKPRTRRTLLVNHSFCSDSPRQSMDGIHKLYFYCCLSLMLLS